MEDYRNMERCSGEPCCIFAERICADNEKEIGHHQVPDPAAHARLVGAEEDGQGGGEVEREEGPVPGLDDLVGVVLEP